VGPLQFLSTGKSKGLLRYHISAGMPHGASLEEYLIGQWFDSLQYMTRLSKNNMLFACWRKKKNASIPK
jgi:hypothetical protein